jgi:drug/metabolite transporter, DME family
MHPPSPIPSPLAPGRQGRGLQPAALASACGAGFLWGTGALVVNLLVQQHGQRPENISFWRFLIGALALVLLFGRARRAWSGLRPHAARLLLAGVCMALYVSFWFAAIARIGAAVPTLIALCLPPVLVTLVALARGRERLDGTLVLWLLAALAGTVLVVARHGGAAGDVDSATLAWGLALSAGSALLYAVFSLVSGCLSRAVGAGPATMAMTLVATAVMALTALWQPLTWPGDWAPEAWLLYLGLVTAALALLAFNWGAARLSPTTLTVATLVEPLTAVLLAAWLLGEHLGPAQWIGAALMLLAIAGLGRRDVAQAP